MAMFENHKSVSIAQFQRSCEFLLPLGLVPMGFGQCGVGKTTVAYGLAKKLNCEYILKFNGQTRETFDIQGMPDTKVRDDGLKVTDWSNCAEFIKIVDLAKKGIRSLIVIDEITNSNINMTGSLCTLALEKRAGSLDLTVNGISPYIIVLGNRPEDNSNYNELPLSFLDRGVVFDITPSAEDFIEYAVKKGLHYLVVSFARQFPQAVNEGWLPDLLKSLTPRGLEDLSKCEFAGIPKDMELSLISGIIGSERATEYVAYRRVANDLPDRNKIYADPETAPTPDKSRPDVLYTLSQSLAYFMTKDNASATAKYMTRLDKEFAVMCLTDAVKREKSLLHNADVKKFAMSNMDVFTDLMN